MTIGVTVGKFMPFHRGHEFMIDFAIAMLDHIDIIVSGKETDEIPLSQRYTWLTEKYLNHNKVKVYCHIDDIPKSEMDENGTALDPIFWEKWIQVFKHFSPKATHFVSSDLYGQKAATLMGIEWLPVDPNREMVSISGTTIRSNPTEYFDYLADVAKSYFIKKVAIVGPESCGKSTITKYLAKRFNTVGVCEYGRIISEAKNNSLTPSDFFNILNGQNALIKINSKYANRILFTDTEAYTTYLFGKVYLNQEFIDIKTQAIRQYFDLYLVLAPSVEWVDDGLRIMGDQKKREQFFDEIVSFLKAYNKNYVIISQNDFRKQELLSEKIVFNLLKN